MLAGLLTLVLLHLLRILYLDSKGHLGLTARSVRQILIMRSRALLDLLHLGQGCLEVYSLLL